MIIELKDKLGDKHNHLEVKFDAPSLWSAIGGLADVVSQLEETYYSKDTKKEIDLLEKGMLKNWIYNPAAEFKMQKDEIVIG